MSDEAAVRVERDGGVATIRLCQPATRNALSAALRDGLAAAVIALVTDAEVRCIVVTGSEGAFCAGGDIRSLAAPMTAPEALVRMTASHVWLAGLLEADKPVVTVVNGPAVGAGFGLAMAGDIVLAGRSAWFMGGFAMIAAVADYGLGRTLTRAVGTVRAKDILLTGRRVDADEAERIGMVARVIDDAALASEAAALAAKLAEGPTLGFALTKRLVASAFEDSAAAYLEREAFAQTVAFGSADHREGVAAFLAKRKPRYEGR